jgi:hypothetical protein
MVNGITQRVDGDTALDARGWRPCRVEIGLRSWRRGKDVAMGTRRCRNTEKQPFTSHPPPGTQNRRVNIRHTSISAGRAGSSLITKQDCPYREGTGVPPRNATFVEGDGSALRTKWTFQRSGRLGGTPLVTVDAAPGGASSASEETEPSSCGINQDHRTDWCIVSGRHRSRIAGRPGYLYLSQRSRQENGRLLLFHIGDGAQSASQKG